MRTGAHHRECTCGIALGYAKGMLLRITTSLLQHTRLFVVSRAGPQGNKKLLINSTFGLSNSRFSMAESLSSTSSDGVSIIWKVYNPFAVHCNVYSTSGSKLTLVYWHV